LSAKPKILWIGDPLADGEPIVEQLRDCCEIVPIEPPFRAPALDSEISGVYIGSHHFREGLWLGRLLQNERILEGMPDGVALLDADNNILWANDCLRNWLDRRDLAGSNFYTAFGSPEILGPDFCPFHTALATGDSSSSNLRCADNRYYHIHCVPFRNSSDAPDSLIVTVRDVTSETLQQQKMAAIHKAGIALADLTAEEVFQMAVEDRIELLKENILHYTKDLLNFDVVEVRLLGQETGELVPLLSEGIDEEAARRKLFAKPKGQGVTGFVAATGKSYLCEDTAEDPLYIEGCVGAKSSLTVPLIQHDKVIGTFNVESPEPRAFSESDLQFLEIFSRDVANALNTLELLVAQQANTAQASVEAIHREVALPVDEILNDAVHVMEAYIGHDASVLERLQRILRNARDIKQLIHKVGQEMAPAEAVPACAQIEARPALRNRRVLVVDDDESVRIAAHNLLDRFSCIVETAHAGDEAFYMVRNADHETLYDVVISAIKLPDMSGYQLLMKLRELPDAVPLVLMTGFGYDPGHTIVKARQAGLPANAILYKPFRLDQLLETVEGTIEANQKQVPQA
jgi:CheY-like chemotaxis protein/GAF domain-containing protein